MDPHQPSNEPTPTSISAATLAELCNCQPSFLSRHRDDLPPTFTVPSGPGRPSRLYSLAELTRFALQHTAELSEAECRLRLALIFLHREGKAKRRPSSYAVHPLPDGSAELEPVFTLTDAEIRSLEVETRP